MKGFKKVLLILLIVLLLLIGLGFLFTYIYADEIKQYGVKQVNELVNTEISVKEIEFSVFKKFPNASLAFKQVEAKEVVDSPDKGMLFSAESIFLQFNIIKLIKGDYSLSGISVENGTVNLKIDKQGKDNYHFWKESDVKSNEFVLELEEVQLKNIQLTFSNEAKQTLLIQNLKKATISGKFSQLQYDLDLDGVMFVETYRNGKAELVKNRNVFINAGLSVNQEKSNYLIKNGAISVEDLHFFLSGDFTTGEEANLANLTFTGNKLSIAGLISLFPEKYLSSLSNYESDGEIKLKGTVRGWITSVKSPEIKIDFSINGGSIKHKPSGILLNNINMSGGITNGSEKSLRTTVIDIDSINAHFGNGTISGKYKISNLEKPMLDLSAVSSGLLLEELLSFFPSDSIAVLKGRLDLNLKTRGYIDDLSKMTVADFRKARTFGKATIRGGSFAFKNSRYQFDSLQTALEFNNNDVKVKYLNTTIFGNDFHIEGFFKNLLPYLFAENEELHLRARLKSRNLNWDDFMPAGEEKAGNNFGFPDRLSFELSASVGEFRFRQFSATNFSGQMSYFNRKFIVKEASFNSMKGKVEGGMQVDAGNSRKIVFSADGNASQVDMVDLFNSFDNFGQNVISGKNLKGICTAEIQFYSLWNEKWEIDLESIRAVADLHIEKGELIDYKPVYSLSKFISVEELNHISFSSLENEIEIKNKKVYIPEMEIKSSALNLTISGIHSFNNEIEYHFNLLLRDILSKKARKAKKENEDFGGHEEDDGLGRTTLFLKMTGTVDDPKITYDRKGLRDKWKDDLKSEKATIKSILKEEFSKQSQENRADSKAKLKEYDFDMEWEESKQQEPENESSLKTPMQEDTVSQKKGFNKWLNKITKPDKDEYEKYDPDKLE